MNGSQSASGGSSVVSFRGTALVDPHLEELFREHQPRLVQYLRIRLKSQSEAEDVAQATFLRLHNRRDTLHAANLKALLYVTARNIATDLLRQKSRQGTHQELSSEIIESIGGEGADVERSILAKQQLALIRKIIAELPEKCRQSFVSYRFEGSDYKEIAEQMRLTESMVRKHVLKATAFCARRFDEMEGWE